MNADQTFFAAYSQDVSVIVAANPLVPNTPPAPTAATKGTVARRPAKTVPASTVPVNSDWYRSDARHTASAPKPHRPAVVPPQSKELFPTRSVEVGCFVTDSDWQTSSLVIAPVTMPSEPKRQTQARNPVPPITKVELTLPAIEDVPDTAEEEAVDVSLEDELPAVSQWKPVWEVDEFVWPECALRLYESQTDYFRYAGEKLLDASREGLKVLAVVSTRDKEGCTTLVACLARSVAAVGARVALFDGNLLNPELGSKLGLDFSCGWQEALDAPSLLNDTAVYSLEDGVTVFPLAVPHRITSLDDVRISRLLEEAARHFDLVIIDAGTVPTGDSQLCANGDACPISAVMIVRDLRRTSETETLMTASRVKALGIDAIGIAENFASHGVNRSAAA